MQSKSFNKDHDFSALDRKNLSQKKKARYYFRWLNISKSVGPAKKYPLDAFSFMSEMITDWSAIPFQNYFNLGD